MKTKQIKLAIFLIILIVGLGAQESDLITSLKKKYTLKVPIQTTFDLEIFWKVREKKEKKGGELILAPEDKFICKIGASVFVSDGLTYWQYNKKTAQVIIKSLLDIDLTKHPSQMINSYLSYSYILDSDNEKEAILTWSSKNEEKRSGYQKIKLWVDKKKIIIKKIFVIDKNGNESTYSFKKTKIGGNLPATLFTYKIPEGVDILDTRD